MPIPCLSLAAANPERVLIVDATLPGGKQSLRCSMTPLKKLRVARAVADLGVDVIEAGAPLASAGDWDLVTTVAREVQGPIIAALARCNRADIEFTADALREAPRRRINVFLAPGPVHSRCNSIVVEEEILRGAIDGVHIARDLIEDVEFSASISHIEWEFLAQVVEAAVDAGASTVNLSDSVGYVVPDEFAELIRYVRRNVRGIHKVRLSVRCSNNLGIAMANSLAAVVAGARQVVCTMVGIGKQGGSCTLEELVIALRAREAFFNVATGIHEDRLFQTSQVVSIVTGIQIPQYTQIC
jgi:2-isopropylmalate synthase